MACRARGRDRTRRAQAARRRGRAHDVAPGAELADVAAERDSLLLHARDQGAQVVAADADVVDFPRRAVAGRRGGAPLPMHQDVAGAGQHAVVDQLAAQLLAPPGDGRVDVMAEEGGLQCGAPEPKANNPRALLPSWPAPGSSPGVTRPSTSLRSAWPTWMPGSSPGMTSEGVARSGSAPAKIQEHDTKRCLRRAAPPPRRRGACCRSPARAACRASPCRG